MTPLRSWWIDPPFLLASSNPTHDDLVRLRLQGFRVVVSLLEEHAQPTAYGRKSAAVAGWSVYAMPIAAGGAPTLEQLGAFMTRLKTYAKSTRLLIHCETGMGRSALIGAAYWIAKGLTVSEAIAQVAKAGVEPGWATDKRKELLRQWRGVNALLSRRPPARVASKPGVPRGPS